MWQQLLLRRKRRASSPKQCDDQKYNESQCKAESHYSHESLNMSNQITHNRQQE